MKNALIIALAALVTFSVSAAERIVLQDTFDDSKNWFRNGKSGKFNFSDAGKDGKCLNIINADNIFMCNISKTLPVKNNATVKVTFDAKGTGEFSLNPMGRGPGVTVYLPAKHIKLTDAKNWQAFEYTFQLTDVKNKKALDNLAFRLNFYKNCNIMVDNFKITAVEK